MTYLIVYACLIGGGGCVEQRIAAMPSQIACVTSAQATIAAWRGGAGKYARVKWHRCTPSTVGEKL